MQASTPYRLPAGAPCSALRLRLPLLSPTRSAGPSSWEAINGRLEALRRNALGIQNLTHYRLRSLIHSDNLAQRIDAL